MNFNSLMIGPRCPHCGKWVSFGIMSFEPGDQFKCKQCETPLQARSKFSRWLFVLILCLMIPVWVVLLTFLLYEFSTRVLPDDWGADCFTLGLLGIVVWCLLGWPWLLVYLSKTMEPWVPTCRKCGYNLTVMSSDQCPECGKVYDPNRIPRINRTLIEFGRIRFKRIFILATRLFCLTTLTCLVYNRFQAGHAWQIGWPYTIYGTGHYHGKPYQIWSTEALVSNLLLALFVGMVVELIHQAKLEHRHEKLRGT
jgi:predicted RNA-binding Zn-ribbon protein involved in translation (DUF1610 family)/uncharacterized membrane protein